MNRLAFLLLLCVILTGCAPVSRSVQSPPGQSPRPPWIPMPNIDHPDIHYVTTVCYGKPSVEEGKKCAWSEAERELGTRFHAFEEDMYVEASRGKGGERRYDVWLLAGVKREKSGPLPPEEIIPSEEPAPPPLPSVGTNPPVIRWRVEPPASFSRGDATRGITFSYTATDDDGIARYQWRLDTRPIDTEQTGRKTFTGLTPGWHTFQVQAIDYQNSMSVPLIHRFEVRPNERPTVRIVSPASGEKVQGKELAVKVAGTDPDGQVVRFRAAIGAVNNARVSTSGEFTFQVADGAQRLFVQAEDEVGGLSDWVEALFVFEFADEMALAVSSQPDSNVKTETIHLPGNISFEMVYIPPGTFWMGSPGNEPGREIDEDPHQVTLTKGFWMGKYEVTQEQWQVVMGKNPSWFSSCGGNCPVERVSWNDCQEFLHKLNRIMGGAKFRLPTEAEWEYACRAGATGEYGGTGNLDDMGWYSKNSGSWTHPVGQKEPNAWGLYDMHGNVWEWCWDWYESYPSGSVIDPLGISSGSDRVLRGGCLGRGASACRSADRDYDSPGVRGRLLGLRLARTP